MRRKKNRYRTEKKKPLRVLARWIPTGLKACTVAVLLLALSAALGNAYHALIEAPWLRVNDIEITGAKRIERKDVLNALGVPRNASVLNLKMSELAKRLEEYPWVRSAVIRLDLPGRLVVEITEREPLAIVYADDFFLMDTEGKLFAKTVIEEKTGLLLLTGFSDSHLKENDRLPPEALEAFHHLSTALKNAQKWLPAHQISECRWIEDEGFVLYTTQKAIPIELGLDNYEAKLQRLQRVFGLLAERQWLELTTKIDLDYVDRVYIGGRFPTPKGI